MHHGGSIFVRLSQFCISLRLTVIRQLCDPIQSEASGVGGADRRSATGHAAIRSAHPVDGRRGHSSGRRDRRRGSPRQIPQFEPCRCSICGCRWPRATSQCRPLQSFDSSTSPFWIDRPPRSPAIPSKGPVQSAADQSPSRSTSRLHRQSGATDDDASGTTAPCIHH